MARTEGKLGAWLRERRQELGLSLGQVQVRTHGAVDGSTLSKVERGLIRPSADTLLAIAPVLKVDFQHLYKLGGYLPDAAAVPEPEPPKPIDTWEEIEQAVKRNRDLDAEQKRGLLLVLKPIVKRDLEAAQRTRKGERRAG